MTDVLDSTSTMTIDWPLRRRLTMAVIGYIPFLLAAAVVGCTIFVGRLWGLGRGFGCGALMIYLLPLLGYRIVSLLFAPQSGRYSVTSAAFLRWWLSVRWQGAFNRFQLPI